MNFIKWATLFFLWASCVLLVTRAFDIVPIAANTIQYIQKVFLTTSGDNQSAVGIALDGTPTGGITISNLSSKAVLGTDSDGKITEAASGDVYNLISGFALGWAGTPGGSTTNVQFNNGGSFSGNNNLVRDTINGRLWIGISNPSYQLDVYQSSASVVRLRHSAGELEFGWWWVGGIGNGANNLVLKAGSSNASNTVILAGSTWLSAFQITDYNAGGYGSYSTITAKWWLNIQTATGINSRDALGINLLTSNQYRLTVTSWGSIGIGTTNPTAKLEIDGVTWSVKIDNIDVGGGNEMSLMSLNPDRTHLTWWLRLWSTTLRSAVGSYTEPVKLFAGMTWYIWMDLVGNVGIGTSSPQYKLDVVGTGRFSNDIMLSWDNDSMIKMWWDGSNTLSVVWQNDLHWVWWRVNINWWNWDVYWWGIYINWWNWDTYGNIILANDWWIVGIGTTTPTAMLTVNWGIKPITIMWATNPCGTTDYPIWTIYYSSTHDTMCYCNSWHDAKTMTWTTCS